MTNDLLKLYLSELSGPGVHWCYQENHHLTEVIQGFVQLGLHATRGFIGDLDGVLQDALWDDVALRAGGGLSTDKHPEVLMASLCMLLQKFL